MDSKVHLLIRVVLCIVVLPSVCKALQSLQIQISPGNRVQIGSDVTIKCSLDQSFGVIDLVWVRRVGSYVQKVGTSSRGIRSLEPDFQRLGRYSLSESTEGTQYVYTLKVTDVVLEDAGTLECQRGSYLGSGETYNQVLAVCENKGSSSCKCMVEKGWASPTCFKVPPDAQKTIDTYKDALIGVVICLAIAIVYGVVVSVMLYRDVIAKIKARAEKKLEELKNKDGNSERNKEEQQHLDINDSGSDGQFTSQYEDLQRHRVADSAGNMYQQINVDVHSDPRMRQHHMPTAPPNPEAPQMPKTPQSLRTPESYHGSSGSRASPEPQSTHVNQAYKQDEEDLPSYEQIKPSGKNKYDNNADYPNGARSKQYNPSAVNNDPRYQHLQSNTPSSHTSGFSKNNTPYQQSPGFNNNNKEYQHSPSPMYKQPPAPYATYDGGLQTISQNISSSKHTPQSTKSERPQHSPGSELHPRGAYTDVQKDSNQPIRSRYTQPKRLNFTNGSVPVDNSGPYVSQTDTVI